jgi:orotate phosphoribosyltransferase
VLCSDCPGPEVDHDEAKYLEWMATVKPLIQPVNPLGYIVTGRLEKYRPQTEAWLARHGITFKQLIMFEAAQSNEERNSRHHEVIAYKAANYAKLKSTLFVESCDHQAEQIASMTGKSVVAWPSQKTFNCD